MTHESAATRRAIETVWRIEAARLLGGLVRFVRDLDQAEDLAQEALLAALTHWPQTGVPENPGAWLMTAAKNRAVDEARRRMMMVGKHQETAQTANKHGVINEEVLSQAVEDDVLRLMLVACHPLLSKDARVALTLRLIAGLSTEEIARAFLSTEATVAQRIVRAKKSLTAAKVPFEVPQGSALNERVASTLEVIYLIFNEGYSATSGESWIRHDLCEEAMRLGRMLVGLVPHEAEAHGLLALMELQASRSRARVSPQGDAILLLDQNRSKWDRLLISRGLEALRRAEAGRPLGYTVRPRLPLAISGGAC